jgi:hypothetical protein
MIRVGLKGIRYYVLAMRGTISSHVISVIADHCEQILDNTLYDGTV